MSNYENTKAAFSRKWIQRALHMNEYMNKNEVVFMSDLMKVEECVCVCVWRGDREMKQNGIKAKVEA